jgi:putative membrane protein
MWGLLISWLVTAVSLYIIAQLNVGVEIRDFKLALLAALVIGLINALLGPIVHVLALPLTVLTLGLFALVVNALLFALAAALIEGFALRNGFWSALIGSVLLSLINAVLFWLLGVVGIA